MRGLTEALRGANGGIEINRLVGAIGGVAYIVGAHVFIAWDMYKGSGFDLTAYCLSFPAGLAGVVTGTAAAVAIKDRNVASATVIERTGKVPAAPPMGPPIEEGEVS